MKVETILAYNCKESLREEEMALLMTLLPIIGSFSVPWCNDLQANQDGVRLNGSVALI